MSPKLFKSYRVCYRFHALIATGVMERVRIEACRSVRCRSARDTLRRFFPNVVLNRAMAVSQCRTWDGVRENSLQKEPRSDTERSGAAARAADFIGGLESVKAPCAVRYLVPDAVSAVMMM